MSWQSGQPVVTHDDWLEWQNWRKARKLECQKKRRSSLVRIDYYPSKEVLLMINGASSWNTPVSTIIDCLILGELTEPNRRA